MNYETVEVKFEGPVCYLQIYRPDANNTICDQLITECNQVLTVCEESANIVVLSGSPEVFCAGADFKAIAGLSGADDARGDGPGPMYDLWLRLATGPYVTICQVRGKANAGGVGFVAACDIVLADETAQFSLSEMLFGLYPACVLPFLIRRVGVQRAHYLTLMTQPISAKQAFEWGLADAVDSQSEVLLRRHLRRLERLSKSATQRYKSYMSRISMPLYEPKLLAVAANVEMFSDRDNLSGIKRFVEQGIFPWEKATTATE